MKKMPRVKVVYNQILYNYTNFQLIRFGLVWFGLGNLINKSLNQESQSKPYQIIPNQTKLAENLYNSVKFDFKEHLLLAFS